MLASVLAFEVRHQLRSPVFWLAAIAFSLLAFGAVASDVVQIGGAIGNVNRNAPYVITQILAVMSLIGVFVTTAFVAGAVLRDHELRTDELFFATPVTRTAYLGGRFLGAFGAAILVFAPVALAIAFGGAMPWLEQERVGPFMPQAYLSAFLIFVIPNLLLMSAVFFGVATLTRSMMGTYVALVAFFVGYAVANTMLGDLENRQLAALADPFGFASFALETRYWTTNERNTRVASLAGQLLLNRAIWSAVALAVLAVTFARFRFTVAPTRRERKRLRMRRAVEAVQLVPAQISVPTVQARHDRRSTLAAFISQTRLEIRRVLRTVAFPIIVAFGVLNLIGSAGVIDQLFGTPVYPVTHLMLQMIQGSFLLFVVIIATLYAGEMVWRDRQSGMSDVTDAMPVRLSVLWAPKLVALLTIVVLVLAAGTLTAIGIQLYHGYTRLEPALYAKGVFLEAGIPFAQIAVLALLAQVITNQKFAGFGVMILYFISQPVLDALDFDHYIYRYAGAPPTPYSDMNGYGHFVEPLVWFYLYWSFAAAILLVLVHLFWVRGRDTSAAIRVQLARSRLRGPARTALAVFALGFLATGGWILYNTNVLNEYVTDGQARDRLARYEKEYKQYRDVPQPRISSVYAEVDIHPEERDLEIRGRYLLVNRAATSIDSLHVLIPQHVVPRSLEGVGSAVHSDPSAGYHIYTLPAPLAPGDSLTMSFDLVVETRGFALNDGLTALAYNGTFFNNYDFFPHIGYSTVLEMQDPNERRKRGLPPVERMPKLEDEAARRNNYLSSQADWLDFETVVSTSPDQAALAPGYLQREWTENGRRYFHYKMDAPILGFFSYLSADWEVARDHWNDVAIEVYYHPDHEYNIDRMILGVKRSLDYYTENFGPYQHRQVRIVEFPRYARFAQSFPNTIPFSESIGFIARLDDDEDEPIDYVFYVTAHEVAHQWWAHQVIGANVQGATVLSETMSQYSALMVMEKEYGPDLMRRFLKYELDGYLAGRGGELIEELPLLRVENQPYIHYRKGSLVMYRMRDLMGEDSLNAALAGYVDRVKFQEPPYTTSRELVWALRETARSGLAPVFQDLFETITLWDLRAQSASWTERGDGTWAVRLAVNARKLRATGSGEETEAPLDDWIDVGVFGDEEPGGPALGRPLLLERRRLTEADSVIEVIVSGRPRRAGIDPYNKLIDRNPEDNTTAVVRGDDRGQER